MKKFLSLSKKYSKNLGPKPIGKVDMTQLKFFHNIMKRINSHKSLASAFSYDPKDYYYSNLYSMKSFCSKNGNGGGNGRKNGRKILKKENKTMEKEPLFDEPTVKIERSEVENESKSEAKVNIDIDPEKEELKTKIDFKPLIFFNHPILPHSTITIDNPNRNDVFLGLALKYGRLTAVDEDTTEIDDITVFFEKEDFIKKKDLANTHLLGTVCHLSYNKQRLIIEGTESIKKIKSLRIGKYKSYKTKDAEELEIDYLNNEKYAMECESLLQKILENHQAILSQLNFKESHFSDLNVKFSFNYEDIEHNLTNWKNRENPDFEPEGVTVVDEGK